MTTINQVKRQMSKEQCKIETIVTISQNLLKMKRDCNILNTLGVQGLLMIEPEYT